MDRVTGHDFYLELVREGRRSGSARASFFPEQTDAHAAARRSSTTAGASSATTVHKTVGIGEWAPRGSTTYQESLRRIGARGWLYHQHLISAQRDPGAPRRVRRLPRREPDPALPGRAALEPRARRRHHRGAGACRRTISASVSPAPWRYLTGNGGGPNFAHDPGPRHGAGRQRPATARASRRSTRGPACTTRPPGATAPASRSPRPTRSRAPTRCAGGAAPQQGWFTKEDQLLGGIGVGRFARSRGAEGRRVRHARGARRQVPQHDLGAHRGRGRDRARHRRARRAPRPRRR